MTRQRMLVVVAVVVALLLALYAVLFLNRGQTESASPFPARSEGIAFVDEAVVHDDLGRMTATADLVVRGTVRSAGVGKVHRYRPSEGLADEVDRVLRVRVEEVLFGGDVAEGTEVAVIEGWWSEGVGYALEGMPWSSPADAGVFYLVRDPGYPAGTYTYVASSGRALWSNGSARVSGDPHGDGPWDNRLAGREVGPRTPRTADGAEPARALEDRIRAAAASARRGDSAPMPTPRTTEPSN